MAQGDLPYLKQLARSGLRFVKKGSSAQDDFVDALEKVFGRSQISVVDERGNPHRKNV
jgi:hypothetical protein